MCGRFTLAADRRTIVDGLDIEDWDEALEARPRYNVAPTQLCAIVVEDAGARRVRAMRWGLVPSWAKDESIGAKMINARSETLTEKASFKRLVPTRRCVVLTDGFYEWKAEGRTKVPHWIHPADGGLLPMAGLWTTHKREGDAPPLVTFTIVTTEANAALASLHHRMPVILGNDGIPIWLETGAHGVDEAMRLARPWDGALAAHPVARLVNDVKNDYPDLIKPIVPLPPAPPASDQLDLF